MASVTIDVDLPPGVTIIANQRHGDGHGFEVSWPWPDRCRCDRCHREEGARIEVKDSVQVVRDLDIWGQPRFWVSGDKGVIANRMPRPPSCNQEGA